MDYREWKTRYGYLKPITMAVLVYLYDNGGQTIGFRELVQKLNSNNQAIKEVLMHLQYNNLITRETGQNNIMIIRLTKKGKEVAAILKTLLETLDQP